MVGLSVFFFFQAEDGIRDKLVTGVQTCALPISPAYRCALPGIPRCHRRRGLLWMIPVSKSASENKTKIACLQAIVIAGQSFRSEERRVGKECRSRWSPYH